MAQVKGTLWFGTNITDEALKTADRIRKQLEEKFAKEIDVKLNVRGIEQIGQQSKRVKQQINELNKSMSAQNFNFTGANAIKAQLIEVQQRLANARRELNFWTAEYKRAMRVNDAGGAASAKSAMVSSQGWVSQYTQQYQQLARQLQFVKLQENENRKAMQEANCQRAEAVRQQRQQAEQMRQTTSMYAHLNSNMKASIGISGQLTSGLAGMYSVYKAKEFLDNVIAIGGQLEQQRVSIGAILHNTAHADELFGKIKNLALQSPFGVIDLDKYTKQLSAYGFQYNELYDMTKRLADISAGAGTDISRLALALGHVKSATYLTGITLRQFSMNNIPMLKMLSEYYSEIEGKLVTTAEVQKRIFSREVGYEAVIEVIKRMTDEGGQFYNMQAIMADTLAGKWKNLKDAVDLMYGSIGESWVGDALKSVASGLTTLTKNWQQVAVAMGSAVTVFGAYRIAAALNNRILSAESATVIKNQMAWKASEAQRLRTVSLYRQLTPAEARFVALENTLTTAELRSMLAIGKVNKEYVLRSIALGKIKAGQAGHLVGLQGITRAEIRHALALSQGNRLLLKTQLALAGVGASLKSLLLTPATGWFLALTAAMEIFMHYSQKAEQSTERINNALNTAQEGYRNLSETAQQYDPSKASGMTPDALRQAVDSMINTLKDYSSQAQNIIRKAMYVNPNEKEPEKLQVRSLADQYTILAQAIQDTTEAYRLMNGIADVFENANKKTGGTWFWNDSFDKNVKDYLSDLDEVRKAEDRFMRDRATVNNALEKSGLFPDASTAKLEDVNNYIKQLQVGSQEWQKLNSELLKAGGSSAGAFAKLGEAKFDAFTSDNRMMKDLVKFADVALKDLENRFGKSVENWGAAERLAAQQSLSLHIHSIDGMTDENAKMIEGRIYAVWNKTNDFLQKNPFKVDADVDRAMKQLSDFQKYLQDLVGKDWVVRLKLQQVGSFEELYDQLDKNVKDGKETMKKLGAGLSEAERSAAESLAVDTDKLSAKQREYRDAYLKVQNSISTAQKEGFKLTALEEKKKGAGGRGGGKGGAKKDAELEAWRLKVQALKDFYAEWNQLRKEIGRTGAYEEIFKSGIMPDMFDENGKPKYDLDNYVQEIDKLNNALAGNTDQRKKAKQALKKDQFKEITNNAKEAADEVMAELQKAIEDSSRKWNLFKNIYEKTGNKEGAMQMVFGNTENLRKGINDAKDYWKSMLNSVAGSVSADELSRMSDTQLADMFGENWKKVKAYRDEYMKAFRTSADEEEKIYLELVEASMTFADKMAKIETQRKKDIAAAKGDPNLIYAANQKAQKSISELDFEKLKQNINWDVVFGNLDTYSKEVLVKVRKQLKDYLKLNKSKMDVKELKTMTTAIKNINQAIQKEKGLFGGLRDAQNELTEATDELKEAQDNYNDALKNYGENAQQTQDALEKYNEAQNRVVNAQAGVKQAEQDTINNIAAITNAMTSLGKTSKASLSDVGNAVGAVMSALGKSGSKWGQLISAIFTLLDAIGNDAPGFFGNLFSGIGHGIYGINSMLNPVGNLYKTLHSDLKIFGDNWFNDRMTDMYSMYWLKPADYEEFEKAKAAYERLSSVWDTLIAKKTEYLSQSWGTEATAAEKEAKSFLEAQIKATQFVAQKALEAGDSMWSHSIQQRMWEGSYKANGQNWKDVADEAVKGMKAAGLGDVKFTGMSDMLNMTSDQLKYLMEKYSELWAAMDDDFREYMEKLIEYYEKAEELTDQLKEKLTGWNFQSLADSWAGTLSDMSKTADDMFDDFENGLREAIINGMISNIYSGEMKQLVDSMAEAAKNEMYTDISGQVKQHTYDNQGNILDTDVLSEYTQQEYANLKAVAENLAERETASRDLLADLYGWEDKNGTSSATQVLAGLSENDQGLLMSYINAIRADVSIDRTIMERMIIQIETSLPSVGQNIAEHTTLLRSIESNTSRNAQSAEFIESFCRKVEAGDITVKVR